jgi:hypothetical protein
MRWRISNKELSKKLHMQIATTVLLQLVFQAEDRETKSAL